MVFFTPLNPSGEDFDEETQDESLAVHRKVHFTNFQKDEQDAVYWVNLVNAQDPGFAILAKKSNAIVKEDHLSGNCIHRVTSLKGEQIYTREFQLRGFP